MDDSLYKMHLIYHPKNIGTFRSARWQKDYTPDLSMMTQESADKDITPTRHIISNFPRSQHRSVIIQYEFNSKTTMAFSES
jgi:hypothetical protein